MPERRSVLSASYLTAELFLSAAFITPRHC